MRANARKLERVQSTVSRKLDRKKIEGGYYLPHSAQQKMQVRRQQSKAAFNCVSEICIFEIKQRLKQYYSPEQIAERLMREGGARISHETIYQMIYADHKGLKEYQKYFRQRRGKRPKRGGRNSKLGMIPEWVGIEHRSTIAAAKTEMGHWVNDTTIGGNYPSMIGTHVDKASRFLVVGLGKNKTSKEDKFQNLYTRTLRKGSRID